MDARERFKQALTRIAYDQLISTGWDPLLFEQTLGRAAEESGATETDARRALQEMVAEDLLLEDSHHYRATQFLALKYEESNRSAAYAENVIRRRVLSMTIDLEEREGARWVKFGPDDEKETGIPVARLRAAARVLDALNLIELDSESQGFFHCHSTATGHDLLEDPVQMEARLPLSPTHDDSALLPIAPDALSNVIFSCKQLLEQRDWKTALQELDAGDREYTNNNWVNAVREYYSASRVASSTPSPRSAPSMTRQRR